MPWICGLCGSIMIPEGEATRFRGKETLHYKTFRCPTCNTLGYSSPDTPIPKHPEYLLQIEIKDVEGPLTKQETLKYPLR